jgi:prepilin-type N-terminal cleavage/methylation domain-containing protein
LNRFLAPRIKAVVKFIMPREFPGRPGRSPKRGFTLIETAVAVLIFAILLVGVVSLFSVLSRSVKAVREQTVITTLASNYLEIARNMPYGDIGTVNGNPAGALADETNPVVEIMEGTTYNIFYEVTYIDDAADGTALLGTDPAPSDYKQLKMFIRNTATSVVRSFLTTATPQGLEGMSGAGALVITVFNAEGEPVPNASVSIQNTIVNPQIFLNRTTNAQGQWVEVGLPPSINGYHIVVTKNGYSSDQTYPITVQNPNPIKPDATITVGQITAVSFSIDLLSNLTIRTLNKFCQSLSGVGVNVLGSKLIGVNPEVHKYNQNLTSSGGQIAMNNIEWDTYTPTLLTGQNLMVLGTSPIQKITVLPGTSQTFTMILDTQSTNSLLVVVKDAATGAALEGATVHLRLGGSTPQDYYGTTGGSVWVQKSWKGGSGQADFVNVTRYFSDDGNIDINSNPTGVRLRKVSGRYMASGQLISSTFDTGAASNFTTLTWQPTSQNPATTLKFQLASNNDNATWDFVGPDGTSGTYYTVSGSNIAPVHDGDRYMRYKVFESTTDTRYTPVLTSMNINYVSGCFTPGQVSFGSLTAGNNYDLDVSLAGYQTTTINNLSIFGNQSIEVLLSP